MSPMEEERKNLVDERAAKNLCDFYLDFVKTNLKMVVWENNVCTVSSAGGFRMSRL